MKHSMVPTYRQAQYQKRGSRGGQALLFTSFSDLLGNEGSFPNRSLKLVNSLGAPGCWKKSRLWTNSCHGPVPRPIVSKLRVSIGLGLMHLRKEFGVCDYGSGLAIRRRVRFVFLGKYPPQGRPFGLGEDSAFVAEKNATGMSFGRSA